MQNPSHAVAHIRMRHNPLTQLADSSWIWLSVVIIVWLYPPASPNATLHITVAMLASVLFYLAGSARQLYQIQWRWHPWLREARSVCICWAWVVTPLFTLGFAAKVLTHFSRVATIGWILLAPSLMILQRALLRVSSRPRNRRAAIAGVSKFSEHIYQLIQQTPALGLTVVGVFDDRAVTRREAAPQAFCRTDSFAQLLAAARAREIEVVYIALPLRAERRVQELVRALQDTTASVYILFDFISLAGDSYRQISYVGKMAVVPLVAGKQQSVSKQAFTLMRALRRKLPRNHAERERATPAGIECGLKDAKPRVVDATRSAARLPQNRPTAL